MTAQYALAFDSLETAGPVVLCAVVLGFVFAECAFIVGLFLPGDSLLITAGAALSQDVGQLFVWALAVAATICAILGNNLGYRIGRRTGVRLLARKGGKVLNVHNVERVKRLLDQRGFWAIVLARWIPWVRTLAPAIAGAAGMHPRKYLVATCLGAVAWVPTLLLIGYYGADLLAGHRWVRGAALAFGLGFLVIGTGYGLWRYRQDVRKPVDAVSSKPSSGGENTSKNS